MEYNNRNLFLFFFVNSQKFSAILQFFSGNSFHILLFLDNSLELTEELERIGKNCKKKWKELKRLEKN